MFVLPLSVGVGGKLPLFLGCWSYCTLVECIAACYTWCLGFLGLVHAALDAIIVYLREVLIRLCISLRATMRHAGGLKGGGCVSYDVVVLQRGDLWAPLVFRRNDITRLVQKI